MYTTQYTFTSAEGYVLLSIIVKLRLCALSNFIRHDYLFMGLPANALAFGVVVVALYAVYVVRFVRLLRRRFFQLDSSSVFRDVFSSVPLAKAVRPMETDRHWGNLPQVKGRLSRRWAKSSRFVHEHFLKDLARCNHHLSVHQFTGGASCTS